MLKQFRTFKSHISSQMVACATQVLLGFFLFFCGMWVMVVTKDERLLQGMYKYVIFHTLFAPTYNVQKGYVNKPCGYS